ncbi:hypothetical protein [Pea streak virus]|uniref:Uncharacterized protein n=1 Tax=Pea streak virus TaxID=157777 RepID=A0A0H3YGY7_9VIRU|nr:hypothetical protein [Pea streak virus]AKN20461.1 hypothetical protein [Pea streak virus]
MSTSPSTLIRRTLWLELTEIADTRVMMRLLPVVCSVVEPRKIGVIMRAKCVRLLVKPK